MIVRQRGIVGNEKFTWERYCDTTRFGEKDHWIFGDPADANMRMPEELKKVSGFVVTKTAIGKTQRESYEGTAFFVSVPSSHEGQRYFYLLTAKHVIVDKNGKVLPNLFLRLNTFVGGREDIRIDEGKWIFHKNPDVDVACFRSLHLILHGFIGHTVTIPHREPIKTRRGIIRLPTRQP
jgi:hypothetical protein